MINLKYNYQPLSRANIDGQRLYATPDGNRLPSVTTILDKTKSEESKAALNAWRDKVGHDKAKQITTEAANRGTRMHTYLEHYVLTGELKPRGSNPYSWASHAMAEKVIAQGLQKVNEFWGVEIPLYFPNIYAGTTDGAGVHLNEDSILDYKQSNKPKKLEWIADYKLQLAAYAEAHNELFGTKIKKGVVLMCVRPEVDAMGNVLTEPQYQEFVIEGEDFENARREWWRRVEDYYVKFG